MSQSIIIIVDDDPVVRHILSTIVNNAGYATEIFASGASCIEYFEQVAGSSGPLPLAIFLDYFLQDCSGIEVLTKLKTLFPDNLSPVIMLSAKTRDEMLDAEGPVNPDYYLEKPFKAEVVLSILESLTKEVSRET